MATRTGTASQINGSAGNGSTSVTVPADCNLAVAFWSHWDNNASSILSALTINSVGFTILNQLNDGGALSDAPGIGVAVLENPATGSRTAAWTWSAGGARAEGGEIVIVYVKDANIGDAVRDSDVIQRTGATNVERILTTLSTDLVLAFAKCFQNSTPVLSGTVFIDNANINQHDYDVSQVTAGDSSTTITMTGENYSAMAAVALKVAVVGTIEVDGTLNSQAAVIAGTAGPIISVTGALASQAALVAGVSQAKVSTTGSLLPSSAAILGAASVNIAIDGALLSEAAVTSGSYTAESDEIAVTAAALASQEALLLGAGSVNIALSGILEAQSGIIGGTATTEEALPFNGALLAQNSTVLGDLEAYISANGIIVAQTSSLEGVYTPISTSIFIGDLRAGISNIEGIVRRIRLDNVEVGVRWLDKYRFGFQVRRN